MLRILFTLALTFLAAQPQQVITARRRAHAASCVEPTIDHIWAAYNPSNTCASTCANGVIVVTLADLVGSIAANGDNFLNTYATNQANSQPGVTYNTDDFLMSSGGVTISTTTTLYAFVKPSSTTGVAAIFGPGAGSGSLEYRLDNGKQEIFDAGVGVLLTGTATLSTSAYTPIVAQVTNGGAIHLYVCPGGSCSSDGSTTIGSKSWTNPVTKLGGSGGDTSFNGGILEAGIGNGSVSQTSIAAWASCQYAL